MTPASMPHDHELDVPLLVEWPDGRREALLFIIEEESDLARFSIHRLIIDCASLAEMYATDRIVPVVVFLRGSKPIMKNGFTRNGTRRRIASWLDSLNDC